MPSFNRVVMIGRLTRDPELRYTASGLAFTTFSIAVDRRYKNPQGERQTDFFRCKAWRQKAEFVANYIGKGRLVAVEGSLENSESVNAEGQKRYYTDIVCDNVEILESTRDGSGGGAEDGGGAPMRASGPPQQAGGSDDYYADEDAPPPRGGNRPMAAGNAGSGAPRPAAQASPPAAARPAPRQPEPAYPADDYDDADPFADE